MERLFSAFAGARGGLNRFGSRRLGIFSLASLVMAAVLVLSVAIPNVAAQTTTPTGQDAQPFVCQPMPRFGSRSMGIV